MAHEATGTGGVSAWADRTGEGEAGRPRQGREEQPYPQPQTPSKRAKEGEAE